MRNTNYNMMYSSSSAFGNNSPTPVLKSYFKSPKGKYKLQCDKTASTGILHHDYGNTVTKVTLAHFKDKSTEATPSQLSSSLSSISMGSSSNVRSPSMKLLGGGATWSHALSFLGENGGNKLVCGSYARVGSLEPSSSTNGVGNSNFDVKWTYLVFNVGDAIFINDLNSQDKDPIKCIHFSDSNPVCHSYDPDSED